MLGFSSKKELIFFVPGNSGTVFTLPANQYISVEQLLKAQESLVEKNRDSVIYLEERRINPRQQRDIPTCTLFRVNRRMK